VKVADVEFVLAIVVADEVWEFGEEAFT